MKANIRIDNHVCITAKTGAGKTQMLQLLAFDLIRKIKKYNGTVIIIDVHGDFANNVMSYVHFKDRERLVYISSTINREANTKEPYTAVLNFFEVPEKDKGNAEAVSIYANEVADALTEIIESSSEGTYSSLTINMLSMLMPSIFTLMFSSPNPSLLELARFFLDKDGQNADLLEMGKASPLYADFFRFDWNNNQYTQTKNALRIKLLFLCNDPLLNAMINKKSTINVEQIMNEEKGKVVVVNVPKGASRFTSSVFSRLMIAYVHAILMRREAMDFKQRKSVPVWLILDEFQNMTGKRTILSALTELRKYGLKSCVLATQSLNVLEKKMRDVVLVNTGIKMVSVLTHDGKSLFAKEMNVTMETLNKLRPLQFLVHRNDGKHTAFKCTVPILGRQYYLSKQEKQELLQWLVHQSGIYVPIAPPAPPPIVQHNQPPKPPNQNTEPKKKKDNKDNPFNETWQPRF